MGLVAAEAGEMVGEGWQREQAGPLRRIAEDAQKGILRERTCGPGLSLMIGKPVVRGFVMNVVLVEERDEDVDVEQRGAIHISSRSRLRRYCVSSISTQRDRQLKNASRLPSRVTNATIGSAISD